MLARAPTVEAFARAGSRALAPEVVPTVDELERLRHVSLVFAAEDIRAPVSMFGHTLLVFHDEPFPEPDAIVVEFVGRPSDVRLGYLRALFAAVPGEYRLRAFRDKELEYDGENRDLWVHTIRLEDDERAQLIRSIRHALAHAAPYNFVVANCSERIHELVAGALHGFDCHLKPQALPVDSVRALARCGRIERTQERASDLRHALTLHDELTTSEQRDWSAATDGAPAPASETPRLADAVGAALSYELPREPDESRRARLFVAKKQHARGSSMPEEVAGGSSGRGQSVARLDGSPTGRWGRFSFAVAEEGLPSQSNADLLDSQVDLLRFGATGARSEVRLDEITVIDVEALVAGTALTSSVVRKLDLSYQDWRARANFAATELALEFGGGLAARPARWASLGLVLSGGFGRHDLDGDVSYSFFPRVQARTTIHPGGVFRWRNEAGAKLWDYRHGVLSARSELALLLGSCWTLLGGVDAMGTRSTRGFAATAGVALSF
ncbi:MAG TPA: DUF4105 domain-containing protein [Polyangia bacterium]|nr:DUF4105 domain-containing protein [Polyangia bacterium]